jgi:hypothetical protein
MATGCRSTGVRAMTKSSTSIEIRDLYKIFGSAPERFVEAAVKRHDQRPNWARRMAISSG